MLSPEEIVRLQLEQSLSQDAIARNKKRKRLNNSILPTFMGENGKVKRLGQEQSNALILPNLYYGQGEEMRPIPTGVGGLMAVDNKPLLAEPVIIPPPAPEPPVEFDQFQIILALEQVGIFVSGDSYSGSIGSTAYGVNFFLPSETLNLENLQSQQSDLPLVVNPIDNIGFGEGTITGNTSSPYYTYKVEFVGDGSISLPISEVTGTSTNWIDFPSIQLTLRSYASLDGGSFNLVTELTHDFTESTQLSPPMFPDPFACNVLEAYIEWEFV